MSKNSNAMHLATDDRDPYEHGPHPLRTDSAILPTRPLEDFVNQLRLWVDNLQPGGLVEGRQRIGKTLAVRYVIANVAELFGAPIPTTLLSTSEASPTSITENRFFAALLAALGYALPHSGTAAVKRQRTIDLMIDRARTVGEHRYLLFVDEAHWLANVQLRYLMDLHNQLRIADIHLISVLVGQPELLDRKIELRRARQHHLLGRFMTSIHHYSGVLDQADLLWLCRSFDQSSEWPAGSGISFTRYFVPRAFDAGWRLEANAATIWKTLSIARQRASLPTRGELPMQALIALIRWLLQTLQQEDREDLVLDVATITSGYQQVADEQIRDYFAPPAPEEAS